MASKRYYKSNIEDLVKTSKTCYYFRYKHSIPWENSEQVSFVNLLASWGEPNANLQMCICYITGNCVPRDYSQAAICLETAAQTLVEAQFYLGICYTYGILVKKDSTKAFYWYNEAAKNGNDEAMCNLGICYNSGFGVERNIELAYDCYLKAAKMPSWMSKGNEYAYSLCRDFRKTPFGNWEFAPSINRMIEEELSHIDYEYSHGDYEESWLFFLAGMGFVEAQRAFLALYSVNKFRVNSNIVYSLKDMIAKWNLQNDPYANMVLGKSIAEEIYKSSHYEDVWNWSFSTNPLYEQCSEALSYIVRAAEGGINNAVSLLFGLHICDNYPILSGKYEYINLKNLFEYWENYPDCLDEDKIYKKDEQICFMNRRYDEIQNYNQICFVDYFSKQIPSSFYRSTMFPRKRRT